MSDTGLLRRTAATLAYRARKVPHDVPPDFSNFRVGPDQPPPRIEFG
jgi:hypothetical protein